MVRSHLTLRARRRRSNKNQLSERLEDRVVLACAALPHTTTVRGKEVDFDQCYSQSFSDDGTSWAINVYYTEQNTADNQAQCDGDDAADGDGDTVPDRCEHALPNVDDGGGNNVEAVAMANEVQSTLQFYVDRNLDFVPAGEDEVNVYIAEDPRGGGIVGSNGLYADDELVADPDDLWKRLLAVHEMQHMVQKEYDTDGVDWGMYGEGVARATEDRFDTALDADTGHLFLPRFNSIMANGDNVRTNDFLTSSYGGMGFWTWFMDQYRQGAGTNPPATDSNDLGWDALRTVYQTIETDPDNTFAMIKQAISGLGGNFEEDFIDYTLALYAHKYNPTDPRLDYLDTQLVTSSNAFTGHRTHAGGPAVSTDTVAMNPRSSEYWEFNPASQCEYTAFDFDGNGKDYAFSIMTVDGGNLRDRWTSRSDGWVRTVRTADLDRIVGVVTALDESGSVDVGHGCVQPTINVVSPTTAGFKMVGRANNPRTFIVRLDVNGKDGSAVSGLTADAFTVSLKQSVGGDGTQIPAEIVNAAYIQEDYWLLVQAPDEAAGAVTGEFYDLRVTLGSQVDTELSSILYIERTQDVMLVLDHSGSMGGGTGKIEAARNAAALLVDELADDDQGAFIAFDTNANVREQLDQVGQNNQRQDLLNDIAAEVPGASTSIGDGMAAAAAEHDARGVDLNLCSIVLLSDGMENEPQYWDDVDTDVINNGCQLHTIALGPSANQDLMQQIAGSSSAGGSYYYATNTGSVPVNSVIGWQNNLSRLYDSIAAEVAGRQRIVTAIRESAAGGAISGVIEFDDLPSGQRIRVGETVKSGGVEITGKPYYFVGGQTTSEGSALIRDTLKIGNKLDVSMGNINLDFDFGGRVNGLSLLFGDFGGNTNLRINGDLRIANDLKDLDGQFVGGVRVAVGDVDGGFRLSLDGAIDQFAIGGQEFAMDVIEYKGDGRIQIPVDDLADELVVSVAWQQSTGGSHQTRLFDPDNNPVPLASLKKSTRGTNDVWRVPAPKPGIYRLSVENLNQEFFVTGTVVSRYELETYVGTTFELREQGTPVPIVASFTANAKPLLNAMILSTVTAPDGLRQTIRLYDDGNHGDSEPNDGLYGNVYYATSLAGVIAPPPALVVDGAEPEGVGSYQVNTVATSGEVRREAQDAFVIRPARDSDGDQMPDRYETEHGLDPKNPVDGRLDPDMDGLPSRCEYQAGTNPLNSDTDGGGESDGSEVERNPNGRCFVGKQNPNDPADDRVRPLTSLVAVAEATANGAPYIEVIFSAEQLPTRTELVRQAIGPRGELVEDWRVLIENMKGLSYIDRDVKEGIRYQYKAMPSYDLEVRKVAIEFEGLRKGQTFGVGETYREDRIAVTGVPYYAVTSRPIVDGTAVGGDAMTTLGTAQDLLLRNLAVEFALGGTASEISLLYAQENGPMNLTVNGHRRIVESLRSLHGETVGGAIIEVEVLRGGFRLHVKGAIDQFAIGGQSLVMDDVIICYGETLTIAGRNLLTPFVQATVDPYSPEGTIQINRGDLTTASRQVTLFLSASDDERESHGPDGEWVFGTPTSKLLMRFSNHPDFGDAKWVPFARQYPWQLDERVAPGEQAFVYAQFQDAQGNVSHGLIVDSIRLLAPGDVNLDGRVNELDIDEICAAMDGQNVLGSADLNGDQKVDFVDLEYLIIKVMETTFGDANLDGIFNSTDLIQVFAAGEYEDGIAKNSKWKSGDWNCDGDFNSTDLIVAFQYGGYNPSARPAAQNAILPSDWELFAAQWFNQNPENRKRK